MSIEKESLPLLVIKGHFVLNAIDYELQRLAERLQRQLKLSYDFDEVETRKISMRIIELKALSKKIDPKLVFSIKEYEGAPNLVQNKDFLFWTDFDRGSEG